MGILKHKYINNIDNDSYKSIGSNLATQIKILIFVEIGQMIDKLKCSELMCA